MISAAGDIPRVNRGPLGMIFDDFPVGTAGRMAVGLAG
jgi:hypothetical protein